MKTNFNISKQQIIGAAIILVVGIGLGALLFGGDESPTTEQVAGEAAHVHEQNTLWTCSMHPQIRQDKPGNCPICGMELIPLNEDSGSESADGMGEVKMSEVAMKIAEVETATVQRQQPTKEVYMPGKVTADERAIAMITSRFPGRIEKLFVSFTGERVRKGQKLATIYSPDLVTAQKELFEAEKYQETNPSFYQAAVNKLKLWDLNEDQIEAIIQRGEPQFYFDVLAPQTGTVIKRVVTLGDYVKEGTELFQIADLRKVWVQFDAYEIDLPWIKMGDKVTFTVRSIPSQTFTSTVTFIDPVIDPKKRSASIRTELNNAGGKLKPQMFANGTLEAVLSNENKEVIIPKTAVLWTGKRAVVYVKKTGTEHIFTYREIELGPEANDSFIVTNGLSEGEEIAVNGVFKIDAAAQLLSKRSMMNPKGGGNGSSMPGMDMGNKPTSSSTKDEPSMSAMGEIPDAFKTQLSATLEAYLALKDALVASDASIASEKAGVLQGKLENVEMTLLSGKMHEHWMGLHKVLSGQVNDIQKETAIETIRGSFGDLSQTMFSALKMFGVLKPVYYQFCPMANDSAGAFWLSETEEIKNPYFGEAMISCGETNEMLMPNK